MIPVRLCGLMLIAGAAVAASVGPSHGSLVIVGGGQLTPEIIQRFIELGGGKEAPMIFVPTAEDGEPRMTAPNTFLARNGVKNVSILHTRDRALADAYLKTRTEKELFALLARGGVIGGSSAGATIQGSYLVRGAVEGNSIM